jgi:hypothetical protein
MPPIRVSLELSPCGKASSSRMLTRPMMTEGSDDAIDSARQQVALITTSGVLSVPPLSREV